MIRSWGLDSSRGTDGGGCSDSVCLFDPRGFSEVGRRANTACYRRLRQRTVTGV